MKGWYHHLFTEKRADSSRILGGLLVRRECWVLSLYGKLLVLIFAVALGVVTLRSLYPFLAVTDLTGGDVLVVEGWIPGYALKKAAIMAENKSYRWIVTCGGLSPHDLNPDSRATYADWCAEKLIKIGISSTRVQAVPSFFVERDRTYSSAVSVRDWFQERGIAVRSADVVTIGPHARRSRLLFQEAFGSEVKVGVIALESPEYHPEQWWVSSEGFKEVVGESIAYLYARFFFYPSSDHSRDAIPSSNMGGSFPFPVK